ncbi:MAG: RdgB/HAM1 family non-canonical purine NTP pyrophosphatase [Gammaproteobacteria bacterium]
MQVVLASNNRGKLAELAVLLDALPLTLVTQGELGIDAADESGTTFVENAIIKARHAARASGLAAIADDSGLVVPALGGAPGVHSARYAGPAADDAANRAQLLAAMRGFAGAERACHFVCVMVYLRHADDPLPLIASASWHGHVLAAPRGTGGFGYDALFGLAAGTAGNARSAAELAPAAKNHLSHRGQAVRALADALAAELAGTAG